MPPPHTHTYTAYQNMTLTCAHTQTYVHTHTRCIHVPKQDAYMCTHIHTRTKEEHSRVLKTILMHNIGPLHMHTHTRTKEEHSHVLKTILIHNTKYHTIFTADYNKIRRQKTIKKSHNIYYISGCNTNTQLMSLLKDRQIYLEH